VVPKVDENPGSGESFIKMKKEVERRERERII